MSTRSQSNRRNLSPTSSACKVMHTFLTDEVFNNENTCIVLNQNCLTYKNFGKCLDIVKRYPYGDVAGLRKPDRYMNIYAQHQDRGCEGDCVIKQPPHYSTGPTIATLMTQFGIGRPIDDNVQSMKVVKTSGNTNLTSRLIADSEGGRLNMFTRAMYKLDDHLSSYSMNHIKNIIIPAGIARSGRVDDVWLTSYLPIIHAFSMIMDIHGKRVILLFSSSLKRILDDEFKHRSDSVVPMYRSLCVNLPVLSNVEYLTKRVCNEIIERNWDSDIGDDDDDDVFIAADVGDASAVGVVPGGATSTTTTTTTTTTSASIDDNLVNSKCSDKDKNVLIPNRRFFTL